MFLGFTFVCEVRAGVPLNLFVFIYNTRHTDDIILLIYDFSGAFRTAIFFLAFITHFYSIGMLTASSAFQFKVDFIVVHF